ncbi:MAG TPA: AraC family transcriptional regulator [Ignavibacteria bacterium]|nr:AraC family transcriptional regulator [Ignavibacteria bacterium]
MDSYDGHGFHGQILNQRQIGNFELTETVYTPGLKIDKHFHTSPLFSIVCSGTLSEKYQNKYYKHSKFGLIYKPSFTEHSNYFYENGAKCLILKLPNSVINHLQELGLEVGSIFNFQSNANSVLITRLRNELKYFDQFSYLSLEGIIIELFAHNLRLKNKTTLFQPDWFRDMINNIDSTKINDLNLNKLAEMANVHPVYLINTFKKFLNMTPGEYLRQKKLEIICSELKNTNKPLLDIAYQFNFSDQSHFNRFFKKYLGITPLKFRKLYNN